MTASSHPAPIDPPAPRSLPGATHLRADAAAAATRVADRLDFEGLALKCGEDSPDEHCTP